MDETNTQQQETAANSATENTVENNNNEQQATTNEEVTTTTSETSNDAVANKQEEAKEELPDFNDTVKVAEYLKSKDINYSDLQEEYNRTGKISTETRAKLAAVGIDDAKVDGFVEKHKANTEAFLNDVSTAVGGREELDTVLDWARKNISQQEAQSIDAVTDPVIVKMILQNLKGRMEDKEGKVPKQLVGTGGAAPSNLYESMAEMKADISDPKYRKDEAFRAKVLKKIQDSKAAGKIRL